MLFYTLGLQCYSNNGQKTKMMIHFCGKKNKNKTVLHNDIWRWKRNNFFSKVKTIREIF